MQSYGDDPQPVIRFDLKKGLIEGWNGCNKFVLEIDYAERSYTSGTLISNERGCYPGWLEIFGGALENNERIELKDGMLTLIGRNGDTLQFREQ